MVSRLAVPEKSKQVLSLCWWSYAIAYFGRVNYAIIIPFLIADLGITKAQTGFVGTVFFWAYALGQYNSGWLGDRINTRWLVTVGLVGSSLCNLSAGLTHSPFVLAVIWGFNGVFQALFWAPLIRLLKEYFSPQEANTVGMIMSTSMIGGYALAWGALGMVISTLGWRFGFWIPSCAMVVYALWWVKSLQGSETGEIIRKEQRKKLNVLSYLREEGLAYLVPLSFMKGFVKEGIGLWAPLLLIEFLMLDSQKSVFLVLLIPFAGFFGIIFSSYLHSKMNYHAHRTLTLILGFTMLTIMGLPIMGSRNGLLGLFLITLVNAGTYGANNILMATIPLQLINQEYAARVTGFLNGSAYFGGGLSGIATGLVADVWGWNAVVLMWIVLLITMLLLLQTSRIRSTE